jgi:hypothetical protein
MLNAACCLEHLWLQLPLQETVTTACSIAKTLHMLIAACCLEGPRLQLHLQEAVTTACSIAQTLHMFIAACCVEGPRLLLPLRKAINTACSRPKATKQQSNTSGAACAATAAHTYASAVHLQQAVATACKRNGQCDIQHMHGMALVDCTSSCTCSS